MQPFFPLALSPGDFSLYISRKKNFPAHKVTHFTCKMWKRTIHKSLPSSQMWEKATPGEEQQGMLSPVADAGGQSGDTTETCTTRCC